MNKLSVAIITKNDEKNIGRCLESVSWADEIVIVDSGSEDNTLKICDLFDCKIFRTSWLGLGRTKKLAVDIAQNHWVFSIDANEEVTENLKQRILTILENPKVDGYAIKRESFYLNQKIKHCGWNNDYPVRLFNKLKANFNEKIVDEFVVLSGEKEQIEEVLLHFSFSSISSHIEKINTYSKLYAISLFNDKKKTSLTDAIIRSLLEFMNIYFLKSGFLDGKKGVLLSINSAFEVFLKYQKLLEIQKDSLIKGSLDKFS